MAAKKRKRIYIPDIVERDVYRPLLQQAEERLRTGHRMLLLAGINAENRGHRQRVAMLDAIAAVVDFGVSKLLNESEMDDTTAARINDVAVAASRLLDAVGLGERAVPRTRARWAVEARAEVQGLIDGRGYYPSETFAGRIAGRLAVLIESDALLIHEFEKLELSVAAMKTLEHEIATRLRNGRRDPEPMIKRALVLAGMPERHARSLFEFESVRIKRKRPDADK